MIWPVYLVQTQFPRFMESGMMDYLMVLQRERKGQAKQPKASEPSTSCWATILRNWAFHTRTISGQSRREPTCVQSCGRSCPMRKPLLSDDLESRLADIVSETDPVTEREMKFSTCCSV